MWLFQGSNYFYPERAYLMLGVPCIVFLFWWVSYQRRHFLNTFFKGNLTLQQSESRSPLLLGLKTALLCLAWMMTTLALMHPYAITHTAPLAAPIRPMGKPHVVHDVILLVDASASMGVPDGRSGESRLTSAQQIADELLTRLHGKSVALYAFTSQLLPEVPLTLDYLFLRLMLRQISINAEETAGTDFVAVLNGLRAKYWEEGGLTNRALTLILFSDGGDTEWESLKGEAKSYRLQKIVDAVKGVNGLQVIAVGLGSVAGAEIPNVSIDDTPVRSALNTEILRALTTTDGQLILGNEASAFETSRKISELLAHQDEYRASGSSITRPSTVERLPDSLYHVPLTLAILSLVAALWLPEREINRSTS